jgi:hypothetical protein
MANISDFKAQLTGGGARANQFRVELAFPSYVAAGVLVGQQAQFLCKGAQLPASTVENIPLNYRGRVVNVAGERTFTPWTVTILNDTNFAIRNAMEQWSNGVQNYSSTNGRTNPREYQVDLRVHQLDRGGAIVKTYRFIDAYPISIGAIELSFDTTNAVEEYTVEFQYNYWTSNTAEGGGIGVNVSIDSPIGSFPIRI